MKSHSCEFTIGHEVLAKKWRSHDLDITLMTGRKLLFLKSFSLSEYGSRKSFSVPGLQGYRCPNRELDLAKNV